MNTEQELDSLLADYRALLATIRNYFASYECRFTALFEKIGQMSFEESQTTFDELHEIQRTLARAKYKYEFPLPTRLNTFARAFDRDDVPSRQYWYRRIQSGLSWPFELTDEDH